MDRSADANWMGGPDNAPRRRNGHSAEIRAAGRLQPPPYVPPRTEPADAVIPAEAAPAVELTDQDLARRIEHGGAAAYLTAVVAAGVGQVGGINTMKLYSDSMARQCVTDDPLQKMLMDLILMGYHRASTLHVGSSQGRSPEEVVAYNSAGIKLQTELRKSMIALRELQRVPLEAGILIQKIVTVQHDCPPAESQKSDTELVCNNRQEPSHRNSNTQGDRNGVVSAKSKAGAGRKNKLDETEGPEPGGKRKASDSYSCAETVAAFIGPSERVR